MQNRFFPVITSHLLHKIIARRDVPMKNNKTSNQHHNRQSENKSRQSQNKEENKNCNEKGQNEKSEKYGY